MIPVALHFLTTYLNPGGFNPFEHMLFISHQIPESSSSDPRYAKGWFDLVFVAYHIVFFSFTRQFALFHIIHPLARRFGVKKEDKIARIGEQGYSVMYYGTMGVWGCVRAVFLSIWIVRLITLLSNSLSWRLCQHGGTIHRTIL